MFTNQNFLNNNISKRNPLTESSCQCCGAPIGTAQHFISECPAYAIVRICIFGVPYISLQQIIEEYGISKLIEFINKSDIIELIFQHNRVYRNYRFNPLRTTHRRKRGRNPIFSG
jgi:hypothetical protein